MIRIANAPCSWGIIENVAGERTTWETVLDEIAATGYAGTELGDWGFMPTDPARLRSEMEKRGLELIGAWVSVLLHDEDKHARSIADAVRTARLLAAVGGDRAVVVLGNDPHTDFIRTTRAGRITAAESLPRERLELMGAGANAVARAVREETGLRTVFHPHIATFVETPWEIDAFLAATDPALVGVAYDTAHVAYGGGDPVKMLQTYGDRIWHVHLKGYSESAAARCRASGIDGVAAVGEGVFCDLAGADIDFAGIVAALQAADFDGWAVVEQDVLPGTGTPRENAERNREFIRKLGL